MATREDASLVMQLLQWGTDSGATEAELAIIEPDFDPEKASATDRHVFVLLTLGETIGTFVKHGVLDRELVDDLWATELVWARVGPAALRQRAEWGVPELWENFEAWARGT